MDINYHFLLKNKNAPVTSIRFRFFKNGKRFVYGTGQKIISALWNTDDQKPIRAKSAIKPYLKDYPQLDTQLQNIENRNKKIVRLTTEWFANKVLTNETPDLEELREYLNSKIKVQRIKPKTYLKKEVLYLDQIIKDFVRAITNGKKLTAKKERYKLSTIKGYRSLYNIFTGTDNIEGLQDYYKTRYTLEDITKEFAEKWTGYMYDQRNSSKSNVGKYHKNFKAIIKDKLKDIVIQNYENEKRGLNLLLTDRQISRINIGLDSFQSIKSETNHVYLTEEELSSLYNLTDELSKGQIIAKDVFLVGCYTALRYSDYKRIKPEHIKEVNGKKYIHIHQEKTGPLVKVPIRAELENILNKYSNRLPNTYEQKVNRLIKEVCKVAKIDSEVELKTNKKGIDIITTKPKYALISTHTARRTGATLMYLAGESPKDIMTITGHKTLSSFESYLKITGDQSLKRIEKSDFFKGKLKVV